MFHQNRRLLPAVTGLHRAGRQSGALLALLCTLGAPGQAHEAVAPPAEPPASIVTVWSHIADRLGQGSANWRSMAIMHLAMHDALNASVPRYARYAPALEAEPPATGTVPELAMAAAAFQVLLTRHPDQAQALAEPAFRAALGAAEASGEMLDASVRLGAAIGLAMNATVTRASPAPYPFPVGDGLGVWRATPPFLQRAYVANYKPLLAESADELHGPPPPAPGTPRYVTEVDEVRRLGGEHAADRPASATEAARFWARQSTQRNMIQLAAMLLAERRGTASPRDAAWAEARTMALLAASLADAFVIAWDEKQRFGYWRPITAINLGGGGVTADPSWEPLLPTPPHPDYPSGHATDCAAGAALLQALSGPASFPVNYPTIDTSPIAARRFPSLAALAEECMLSRIWAGAHFRAAGEEGKRLGEEIAARALAALAPVPASAAR